MRLCALPLIGLLLCLALAGCDKCGNWITINTPHVPGSCTGQNQGR